MVLTEPFKRMAGDKANLIPNLQAAGKILKEFIELAATKSDLVLSKFDYDDEFGDGLEDRVFIQFETEIDGEAYESAVCIYPAGDLEISLTVYDEHDMPASEEKATYKIWTLADSSAIVHQVIQHLIEDPEEILATVGIDFKTTYAELMADPQPEQNPQPPAPAEQPGQPPAKRGKKWGLF